MNAHRRKLAVDTLTLSAVLAAGLLGVMVCTDEPGSTAAMRFARLCVFTPAVGALAATITTQQQRRSGAERALESLGSVTSTVRAGAVAMATVLGLLAAMMLLTPLCDVTSLFPVTPADVDWVRSADGFLERKSGTTWTPAGFGRVGAPTIAAALSAHSRWAAFLCATPLALTLPVWACQDHARAHRWAVGLLTASLVVVYLHAHAAGRVGASVAVGCSLPLAVHAFGGALTSLRGRARAQAPNTEDTRRDA